MNPYKIKTKHINSPKAQRSRHVIHSVVSQLDTVADFQGSSSRNSSSSLWMTRESFARREERLSVEHETNAQVLKSLRRFPAFDLHFKSEFLLKLKSVFERIYQCSFSLWQSSIKQRLWDETVSTTTVQLLNLVRILCRNNSTEADSRYF